MKVDYPFKCKTDEHGSGKKDFKHPMLAWMFVKPGRMIRLQKFVSEYKVHEPGQSVQLVTKTVYASLIDVTQSDPDNMMTAVPEAQSIKKQTGQVV